MEGDKKDAIPAAKLGTYTLSLNDLAQRFPLDSDSSIDSSLTLKEELSPGKTLASGEIEIEF